MSSEPGRPAFAELSRHPECGLDVVLLDERPQAGGQVYRAPRAPANAQPLIDQARSRVTTGVKAMPCGGYGSLQGSPLCASARLVRPLDGQSFQVEAFGDDGPITIEAAQLIAATGAHERVVPFPAGRCRASSDSPRRRS